MAKFTVRVELRDSEDADYNELHKLMEEQEFSRTITTSQGNTYCLPSAEYIYTSNDKDKEDVADLAESVASKVKKKPRILVTESNGRYVKNLDDA
ncbi:type V toxin-antitoxin system endoribonuclease antitoxin GhoS [Enterobacter asburiae]|uniref:type V toxin-antitoxin system endoribonuclease antitoxin GhoS n=1 Tax=Enterobacter asburiae TaxID=61645 RepID=UPI00301924EA